MIHVKQVSVNGASFFGSPYGGYWVHTPLTMIEYSKGNNKVYYIGLTKHTKDECNNKYLELKHNCKNMKNKQFEHKTIEYDIPIKELEENLMEGYDYYTEYIEDYKQQQSTIQANNAILDKIKTIKEL